MRRVRTEAVVEVGTTSSEERTVSFAVSREYIVFRRDLSAFGRTHRAQQNGRVLLRAVSNTSYCSVRGLYGGFPSESPGTDRHSLSTRKRPRAGSRGVVRTSAVSSFYQTAVYKIYIKRRRSVVLGPSPSPPVHARPAVASRSISVRRSGTSKSGSVERSTSRT